MQEVVRRGDYYEIDVVERELPPETKKKAEEPNPNILTADCPQQQAIEKFSLPATLPPTDNRLISLREQLHQIQKDISRQPKKYEAEQAQIKNLLVQLANLQTVKDIRVNIEPLEPIKAPVPGPPNVQEYKLVLPLNKDFEKRVKRLEDLDYPKLSKLQQLTSILLGQHFANQQKLQKSKHNLKTPNIATIYNRFQKLEQSIDEFPQLVERINQVEHIHCQIVSMVERFRRVTQLHYAMLEEVGQNVQLAKKLQQNFSENKKRLQETISVLKRRAEKLRKK